MATGDSIVGHVENKILLAAIVPSALPALRVAGALFLIINLLAGAWAWRHRRQLFGPDSTVPRRPPGDSPVTGGRARHSVALSYGSSVLYLGPTLDGLTTLKVNHWHEVAHESSTTEKQHAS